VTKYQKRASDPIRNCVDIRVEYEKLRGDRVGESSETIGKQVLLQRGYNFIETENGLKGVAERALEAGCDVYMSKPINVHELRARVEAFVPSSK
jgi:hypothetical protein